MIILVMGRRELGKSTLAASMALRAPYSVWFDPRHLFNRDGVTPIGDLTNEINYDALIEDLSPPEPGQPTPTIAIVQPNDYLEESSAALAAFVRRWTHERADRLVVVLDEAALYSLDAWTWVVRCAPRDQIDLIITAHRPQDIPTTVRALADKWCVFRTTQPHDLEAIEERCGARFAQTVQQLPPRHFAVWDDALGNWSTRTNPAAWYVPIRSQSRSHERAADLVPGEPEDAKVGLF